MIRFAYLLCALSSITALGNPNQEDSSKSDNIPPLKTLLGTSAAQRWGNALSSKVERWDVIRKEILISAFEVIDRRKVKLLFEWAEKSTDAYNIYLLTDTELLWIKHDANLQNPGDALKVLWSLPANIPQIIDEAHASLGKDDIIQENQTQLNSMFVTRFTKGKVLDSYILTFPRSPGTSSETASSRLFATLFALTPGTNACKIVE